MKPVFRCSELATVLWCPGSKLLTGRLRAARKDTTQAAAGKWMHARAAHRLRDEEGATGPVFDLPKFDANRFHHWIVDYYIDTVRMYVESQLAIAYEQEMTWEFDRFILSGHMDVFAIDAQATEFTIGDLKSGPDPVTPADENAQVLGYMVLAGLNYPTAQRGNAFLCQPLNNPDDGLERVTVARAENRAALETQARYLERELNHALDRQYDLNSDGWRQCHYCPAALVCPAFLGDLLAMKMTLTPEALAAIPEEPDIERLFEFETAKKKFSDPFDRAHEALKEKVQEMGGAELKDGTKLYVVDRPGKRTITNNALATDRLSDLPDALFHETYSFSAGAIEEALATHRGLPKTSKKGESGQSAYKALLGDITTQAVNKVLKVA
jgi:PD-(D/E)XK nuclease superfamily